MKKLKPPKIKKIKNDSGPSASDFVTADNTLKLVGKTEARARIVVYDDFGQKIGTTRADKKGKWVFETPKLKDGEHDFQVEARKFGFSRKSDLVSVLVDTQANAPTIAGFSGDSGVPGDHITSNTALLLTGVAEAGATVEVFRGATLLGSTVANGAGNWSIATGVLGQGVHSFTAKMTDIAGNISGASGAFAVTVDTVAPAAPSTPDLAAASDTGSSDTDNYTSDTTPTLTGTAEAGATVTIKDGATVLGTALANGAGAWSFTTGALGQGTHSFTTTATDTAGNNSTPSSPLTVTIDTAAPTAPSTPDLAVASDTGTSTIDNITADTTPTLTGTAEAGATVTVKDGATVLGTAVADGAGAWTFTTGVLGEGEHSFTATATTRRGTAVCRVLTVTIARRCLRFRPSRSRRSIPVHSTDDITKDTTPKLTGTAEPGSMVTITDGATVLGTSRRRRRPAIGASPRGSRRGYALLHCDCDRHRRTRRHVARTVRDHRHGGSAGTLAA